MIEEYLARYSVVLRLRASSKEEAGAKGMTVLRLSLPEHATSSIKFKECVKADIAYKRGKK